MTELIVVEINRYKTEWSIRVNDDLVNNINELLAALTVAIKRTYLEKEKLG